MSRLKATGGVIWFWLAILSGGASALFALVQEVVSAIVQNRWATIPFWLYAYACLIFVAVRYHLDNKTLIKKMEDDEKRRTSGELYMNPELEEDTLYNFFRLRIENHGTGQILEPRVTVEAVIDDKGKYILPQGLGTNEVRWSGIDHARPPLAPTDGWNTLGFLNVEHRDRPEDAFIRIDCINDRHEPLDRDKRYPKFWVLAIARADNSKTVQRWFAVERDTSKPMRYRVWEETPPVLPN